MGDNNISEKLKALATGSNRSATARLREIFEEIEAALQSGVRRKDVYQTLTENGFSISFASFELAIYRIRKAREMGKNKTPKPQKSVLEKGEVGKAKPVVVAEVKKVGETKPGAAKGGGVVNGSAAPGELTSILRGSVDLKQFRKN